MMNIKAHVSEENDGIDRITSLPNDVLTHILSFLNTKNAVETCILSKRWINTWASVSDLKFDIKEFRLPENIKYHEMSVEEFLTKFELLVKNVLEKREAFRVNKFQLCLDSGVFWPCKFLVNYIGDVMKLEPRECSIKLRSREKLNLITDLIFTCASLIYLELCLSSSIGCIFEDLELNSVNLPCLKTLKLDRVMLSNDSLKKLLLGCPVLEELVLEHIGLHIVEIYSNTLKKLVFNSFSSLIRLQIFTPNLQYLDISEVYNMTRKSLLNMPSLVDASIFIHDWQGKNKYVTSGLNLIHNLSNVESLRINLSFPKQKTKMKDLSFPFFKNLKCLKFVSCRFNIFDLPLYFLHHSPKLEELTLANIDEVRVTDFLNEETTLEGMGLVQREYLKIVRIVGFKNNNNGFVDRLINMFLSHVKIIGDFVISDLVDDC